VSPSGATTIPNISLASGSGAIGNGGTIEDGGAWASTNMRGPLFTFNLVMEFFCELQQNYQKVKIEKLQSLQNFQCKPHESL